MISGRSRFNIYLLLALATAAVVGCKISKDDKEKAKEKQLATFRVHLETGPLDIERTTKVEIYRAHPVQVAIDKDSFLSEVHVAEAKVVDVVGGFDLRIQLTRQGAWLLQNYSASNPERHFAIFSQFGKEKEKEARWLAAPVFKRLNATGVIQFAPDATREEAEDIALGLNNVAKKVKAKSQW